MTYKPFRRLTTMTTMTAPTIIAKITAATTPPISPPLMLSNDDETLACVMFCSVPFTKKRWFAYKQKVFTRHCYFEH